MANDEIAGLADHIRRWASEQSAWNVGSVLSDLGALDDSDLRLLAKVILDYLRGEGWMDSEQVGYEVIEAQERMED